MTKFIGLTEDCGETVVINVACIALMRKRGFDAQATTHILLTTAQNLDQDNPLLTDNDVEVKESIAEIYQKIIDAKEL
jgi:predicted SpoU family rRNA methylase